jgi:hypothetical protein
VIKPVAAIEIFASPAVDALDKAWGVTFSEEFHGLATVVAGSANVDVRTLGRPRQTARCRPGTPKLPPFCAGFLVPQLAIVGTPRSDLT